MLGCAHRSLCLSSGDPLPFRSMLRFAPKLELQNTAEISNETRDWSPAAGRAEASVSNKNDLIWNRMVKREPWLKEGIEEHERDVLVEGFKGMLNKNNPVRSLDQLYAQASGLNTPLLRLVQLWALKSNGYFFKIGGGFMLWKDARDSAERARMVKWGALKRPSRAIEKLLRCQTQNFSCVSCVIPAGPTSLFAATSVLWQTLNKPTRRRF